MRAAAAVVALFGTLSPSLSMAGPFSFQDFPIAGATNVTITGINDFGAATGTYLPSGASQGAGFYGRRGMVTTLTDAAGSNVIIPVPTGISNDGTVIGTTYGRGGAASVFTWRNGSYTAMFPAGVRDPFGPLLPPYLGTEHHVSFNAYIDRFRSTSYAGIAGQQVEVSAGLDSQVVSTNRGSSIAGEFPYLTEHGDFLAVFFRKDRNYLPILPPGATASRGGWLNDANQVAGSYQGKDGILRGFIYTSGRYASFDMPVAPAALSVQGIDMSGRVVGTYMDATRQYAFIYTHGAVVTIGHFRKTTSVHVSISHFGRVIAVSAAPLAGGATSYLVRCAAGPGHC